MTKKKNPSLKKQVDTNTHRFKVLMKDVRNDVKARTRNSKDLDEWLEKLQPYVGENCLVNGIHGAEAAAIIRSIVKTVEMTKLPPGANQEIVKGVMSEVCMTYVTNVGKDIQTEQLTTKKHIPILFCPPWSGNSLSLLRLRRQSLRNGTASPPKHQRQPC